MSRKSRSAQFLASRAGKHANSPADEDPFTATISLQTNPSPPMLRRPLLVASLGNPGPLRNTFHSAGHVLLAALAAHRGYPPFLRSKGVAGGLTSRGQDGLLWQSPTLMNVSGPAVSAAWRQFKQDLDVELRQMARLVVIHDELELPLGKIKVSKGGSAKGHNGLKSCIGSLGGVEFWKLGVGIGRPASRESGDVASFVLRKMKPEEQKKITAGADDASIALGKLAEAD